MAVRFSASGQRYTYSGATPGTVFTVCCWINRTNQRSDAMVWQIDDGTDNDYYKFADRPLGGVTLLAYEDSAGGSLVGGPTLTSGTWYAVALVVNGVNATMYWRSASQTTFSSDTVSDWGTSQAHTTWRIGQAVSTTAWFDGRVAAFKAWTAALSLSDITNELSCYMPQRTTSLTRWHPFVRAETADYSGLGRTLSGGTGATTEAGPPIPWRPYARPIITTYDRWYAHYDTTSGELLSLGTVEPTAQAGTAYLTLMYQPDLTQVIWDTTLRDFVPRTPDQVDRVQDLVNDASIASVWTQLDATNDQLLQDRIAALLGPYRYRLSTQPVNLE